MNPLLKRLASLRLKVRFLDGWLGTCAIVALVLGVGVGVGVLDYWAHLPSLARAVALVGLLVGAGYVGYRYLLRPFARPCDDLSLALRVEQVYPELNDALASTVQFLKQSPEDEARVGGSADLRARTVQDTIAKAGKCDFSRILDRKGAALFGVGACLVLAAAALIVFLKPQYAGIAFWRFVEPFGPHPWTQITVSRPAALEMLDQADDGKKWEAIDLKKEDRIAIGRPYFIKIDLQGQIPKQVRIEVEGQIRSDRTLDLKPSEDKLSASRITAIDMTQQYQKFKFRILANDGSFPPRWGAWHVVAVSPPPKLIDLDGLPSPQLTLYPPAYTDLPSPAKLLPGTRHLELYAGTNVVLRAKADRRLAQAWIEYKPENTLVTPKAMIAFFGQTSPLHAIAQAAAGSAVWGRIPAQFEPDGQTFRIAFMPWVSGGYVLNLRDPDRLEHQEASDLRVLVDPLPDVKLVRPGTSVTAVPDADIAFRFRASDEFFAVKSVFVEYRKKNADGTPNGDVQRNVLYDAKDYGKLLPYLLAKMGRSALLGPDLRLRYKQLDFDMVWSLKNQFKEGEHVEVTVCADDFCDLYPTRAAGKSHTIELHIVGRTQLVKDARGKLGEIQKQLKQIENMQRKALDTVKDTKNKDKIEPKDREKFIDDGEQVQRTVQEMIGNTPEQGLRREIKELRQVLRDNKETGSQPYRDAGMIKGTLDRVAQGELPQIEPKLADVRNDLSNSDKNTDKTKKTLEQAAKLQKNVLSSLEELNKTLDPLAKMQEQRDKLNDVLTKQRQLQSEIEDLNDQKRTLDEATTDPKQKKSLEQAFKEQFDNKSREQKNLSMEMDKLLQDLKAAKEQFDNKEDKQNADKIQKAIDKLEPKQTKAEPKKPLPKEEKADKTPTAAKMKNAADDLKGQSEAKQKTLDQQKAITQDLESALKALDGPQQDTVKEDIQKRKDAEKKIDDLAKKLKNLQDQVKKAEMLQDKEERLKKKEELAQQHQQLQEEIEKTARELARLQEHPAANKLDEAAKNMEKAAKKLNQGENPQEQQADAQKELKQAKADLQEAEEELARELLVKMADQLKGLHERQVAALERSEALHGKVMKKKSWSSVFLDTMDRNMDAQKGIADETDTFKEKLKAAKVFYSILERAKDSMDKAGEVMKTRHDEGKDRCYVDKMADERMDAKEMEEENDWHKDTLKHQKQAAQRLDRLLDAIKQELAKKKRKKDPEQARDDGMDPNEKKEQKGGIPAADGIPPMAQLKALMGEQLDLNERTEDFAKRHPDTTKLTEPQRQELRALEQEQDRLQSLFGELVAPPKEGEQP